MRVELSAILEPTTTHCDDRFRRSHEMQRTSAFARLIEQRARSDARAAASERGQGLASPHRAGNRCARVPDPRAPPPTFSPAYGLTLPQIVRLLQPIFKCWAEQESSDR